jgi:hypothetical protein
LEIVLVNNQISSNQEVTEKLPTMVIPLVKFCTPFDHNFGVVQLLEQAERKLVFGDDVQGHVQIQFQVESIPIFEKIEKQTIRSEEHTPFRGFRTRLLCGVGMHGEGRVQVNCTSASGARAAGDSLEPELVAS